jgi:hypothetical protein
MPTCHFPAKIEYVRLNHPVLKTPPPSISFSSILASILIMSGSDTPAASSNSHETVSTLTTAHSCTGASSNTTEEETPLALLPLKSIFDCSYISSIAGEGGKSGWECGWCGSIFSKTCIKGSSTWAENKES